MTVNVSATLDWTVFWASIAVALAASMTMAAIVAATWWRGTLRGTLASMRTGGVSVRGGRLEVGLVVGQVALAVILGAGAGLLIRSANKLRTIDPGVDVGTVAVLDVTVPARTTTDERRRAYLAPLAALQAGRCSIQLSTGGSEAAKRAGDRRWPRQRSGGCRGCALAAGLR